MQFLKQSIAATVKMGPFLDETDGITQETGLTISQADIRLSKNGGAFAQTNNAAGATHDEKGWYGVPLDTTDTNTLGRLMVAIHESGALPVWREFMVIPANEYDSLVSGSDNLQVETIEFDSSLDFTATMKGIFGVPKNVALSNFSFLMVLSSDHVTPATSKVITAQISQDGGAFASCSNAVSEVANGVYKINLTQAEMNADVIVLKFTNDDCDQRTVTILTNG